MAIEVRMKRRVEQYSIYKSHPGDQQDSDKDKDKPKEESKPQE